jgi:glyoxylase-like metal-dependent hydrolase (beta-lactamase superfamily II)
MADDPFDRDPAVVRGVAEAVGPGVRRVVAPNPSPMTFTGTATYLVGDREAAVIDPGPDDPGHRAAILAALGPGARVRAILVTHSHRDHSAGAPALAAATGAPVLAFGRHGDGAEPRMAALAAAGLDLGGGEGADRAFAPDATLADGETVGGQGWRLTAVHTPGHLSNHLAFALGDTGCLFTGDAVMGWATTLVSPPDGDMARFMTTLARLRRGGWRRFLPGHGRPVEAPDAMLDWQIGHRRAREAQILAALADGPADAAGLARRIYVGLDPALLPAAARNVLAHLLALEAGGRVAAEGPLGAAARFARSR